MVDITVVVKWFLSFSYMFSKVFLTKRQFNTWCMVDAELSLAQLLFWVDYSLLIVWNSNNGNSKFVFALFWCKEPKFVWVCHRVTTGIYTVNVFVYQVVGRQGVDFVFLLRKSAVGRSADRYFVISKIMWFYCFLSFSEDIVTVVVTVVIVEVGWSAFKFKFFLLCRF